MALQLRGEGAFADKEKVALYASPESRVYFSVDAALTSLPFWAKVCCMLPFWSICMLPTGRQSLSPGICMTPAHKACIMRLHILWVSAAKLLEARADLTRLSITAHLERPRTTLMLQGDAWHARHLALCDKITQARAPQELARALLQMEAALSADGRFKCALRHPAYLADSGSIVVNHSAALGGCPVSRWTFRCAEVRTHAACTRRAHPGPGSPVGRINVCTPEWHAACGAGIHGGVRPARAARLPAALVHCMKQLAC